MKSDLAAFPRLSRRRYQDIREDIRTGDLLLCSGRGVMSRLIQRATRSPWSHVALIARLEGIDRVIVLESVESIGVRAVPLSHYVHDDASDSSAARGYDGTVVIARHEAFARVEPGPLRRMWQFAADRLGRDYDKAEILRIAGRILRHELGSRDEIAMKPDGAFICSEYVWECYRAAGIDVAFDARGFIAPCDFAHDARVYLLWELETEP